MRRAAELSEVMDLSRLLGEISENLETLKTVVDRARSEIKKGQEAEKPNPDERLLKDLEYPAGQKVGKLWINEKEGYLKAVPLVKISPEYLTRDQIEEGRGLICWMKRGHKQTRFEFHEDVIIVSNPEQINDEKWREGIEGQLGWTFFRNSGSGEGGEV
jgi:hypothetical protein